MIFRIHRIEYIKAKVNDILENIVSCSTKCYIAATKNLCRAEFLRKAKTKKRKEKYFSVFLLLTCEFIEKER